MSFTSDTTYIPHSWFNGPHLMTLAPAFWPRKHLTKLINAGEPRLFQVSSDSQVLAHCHWQSDDPRSRPTVIVIHGLEGSSDSAYVLGLAHKALAVGMNAIRLNLRNCGGTMHLTPTLYNGGLSADVICVLNELYTDGYTELFLCGYSLGGNIVLKAAGELGRDGVSIVSGVAAVSPSLDLAMCVKSIELPGNRFYDQWFVRSLKAKIRAKAKLYPDVYDVSLLKSVRTLKEFDNTFTAPAGGYGTGANYYHKASSIHYLKSISTPTLIITAEDDPLVPFAMFQSPQMNNPQIRLNATKHGGHAGFIQHTAEGSEHLDHFWAENRAVGFFEEVMRNLHHIGVN